MIGSRRRSRSTTNVWPGYVDALSALLMLVIFMLLVYVVSQLYLSQTLSDRDTQLARLNAQLNELSELLGLEENRSEALENQLTSLQERNNSLVGQLESTREQLMRQTAMADAQSERLASMEESIDEKDDISAGQQAMILRLSNQIASLREQLRQIASALELQEQMTADKEQELEQVSRRLNTLLAERVNQLEQYQSEFFARLRDILAGNENVRIVGDRFLLPSELLFASASAELGEEGRQELDKLADAIQELSGQIPDEINWVLRVDGHTDARPLSGTGRLRNNWELSAARAISVVRYLIERGVDPKRLVAAGFGEFQPLDTRSDEIAYRRNRRIEFKLTER